MRAFESFTGRRDDRRLAFIKDGVELRAGPPPPATQQGDLRRPAPPPSLLAGRDGRHLQGRRRDVRRAQLRGRRCSGLPVAAAAVVFDAASPEDEDTSTSTAYVDADVFKALLYFMYTGTLPPPAPETMPAGPAAQDDDGAPAAAMAQQLIAAADRFCLDRLETMRLRLLCEELWTTGDNLLQCSQRRRLPWFKDMFLKFGGGAF
uniref:BTB domain-containing protein n=1 Tax=Oryza glumipatula TaxID=40148 RepID=A0A0E0BL82_9ORYZ